MYYELLKPQHMINENLYQQKMKLKYFNKKKYRLEIKDKKLTRLYFASLNQKLSIKFDWDV